MTPSFAGTPVDPDPNKPFAKIDCKTLFNDEGQLNPSITILGSNVVIPPEVIIYNTIVLPHKALNASYKNQIILWEKTMTARHSYFDARIKPEI